jgi:integrase
MASVHQRGDTWYLRYKDGRGHWRSIASSARTKTEAKRMVGELEMQAERQRLGLEMLPPEDDGGTVAELFEWWLETYVKNTPSYQRTVDVVGKNFLQTDTLRLIEVTPGRIEQHLQSRAGELSPDSLNHLRSFLTTAFNRVRQTERWLGTNPVKDVRRRRVPKRLPDFLRADEVPRVLSALLPHHRPLFATAIYTGLRKGSWRVSARSMSISSWDSSTSAAPSSDTTKGGKAAAIPIAAELRSYLEQAMTASSSDLVFPGKRKPMMTTSSPLEQGVAGRYGTAQRTGTSSGRRPGCVRSDFTI